MTKHAEYTEPPDPVEREDGWWIPRFPPHWFQSQGPYESEYEAEIGRGRLELTINSPSWRSHIMDLEEEGLI